MDPSSMPNQEDQQPSATNPNNQTERPVVVDESNKTSVLASPSERAITSPAVNSPASDTYTTNITAPVSDQPVVGIEKKRRRLFTKPVLIGAILALFAVGGAAGYFGYVVPNKPENVWNAALVNTGKVYDKLTEFATTQDGDRTGSIVDGSYRFTGGLVADGTFSGKNAANNSEFKANISASGLKLDIEMRTIESSTGSPDLYVKASGLKGLGALMGFSDPYFSETFNGIDNQWYFVDHTLFDQMSKSGSTAISQKDTEAFIAAVGQPSKEYLFTANADKAVFVPAQTLPAETRDGRSVYHYKVSINKDHFKKYLNALCGTLKQDKIGKLVLQADRASGESCESFAKRADNIGKNDTADVWVDRHTKLVHAVRFTDKEDAKNYLELNQDYQGGSQYPFGIIIGDNASGRPMKIALKGSLDSDTRIVTIKGDVSSEGDNGTTGTFNLTVKPNPDTKLKVTKPAGAKAFAELLNDIGLGAFLGVTESGSSTSIAAKARDTERQTDIQALYAHIEAYYAENGNYPTLANLNNQTWRQAHMRGLDDEALRDPNGATAQLAAVPTEGKYAYQVSGDLSKYTLTAMLENGSTFKKSNL